MRLHKMNGKAKKKTRKVKSQNIQQKNSQITYHLTFQRRFLQNFHGVQISCVRIS